MSSSQTDRSRPDVLIVAGPTASGKSALAVDLAEAVGADLTVMASDAARMRGDGPVVMAAVKSGHKLDDIAEHILGAWRHATQHHGSAVGS